MANLPSHEQLQDDPFGFRDEYRDSAKPEDHGFMDTEFPTPSEYGAQVRQYDAGRPTADPIDPVTLPASRSPLSVDSPPQAQPAPSYAFPRPLVSYRQDGLNKLKEINDPSAIVSGINAQKAQDASLAANPAMRMGLSGDNAMLVAAADNINRGNNRAPLPSSVVTKNIETPISVPVVDARNNAPMPVPDPAKTIAKGRTLGPGITLSQTELGEVAAFGPDGQVVNLKDPAVRKRFNLPTGGVPKTANPGTVLSESRLSPLTRKQIDVYNADRANGYTGRRDYISPFLSPDQQRARQNEIYAQRQADLEATAQRLATENTIADLESQRTGVPTTSARNRSMLPTSERVMGERQDRMAHERVSEQRNYNMMAAKQAVEEKDASLRDSTTRRGQDIEADNSRRAAQDNAENRKTQERIAQLQYGSKTQRDYQREAMLKARSEALKAALSSDPNSVESPEFKAWLDETYPLMTPEERLELEKQGASAPDAKKYK